MYVLKILKYYQKILLLIKALEYISLFIIFVSNTQRKNL